MGNTAIILAGGLGTRLRSVLTDIPKCMAPVSGKPFLYYVIEHFKKEGIENYIFSLGHLNTVITSYLNAQYSMLNIQYSIEDEPLGTGGAIKRACSLTSEKNILVVNGDTLFSLNVQKLMNFHLSTGADCTLSLKPMKNFNRYGVIELNTDDTIASFKEKQYYPAAHINAGVYVLQVPHFLKEDLPQKFSFEKDYLEKLFDKRKMYGQVQDEYFIDIGIPEDYERAQKELIINN